MKSNRKFTCASCTRETFANYDELSAEMDTCRNSEKRQSNPPMSKDKAPLSEDKAGTSTTTDQEVVVTEELDISEGLRKEKTLDLESSDHSSEKKVCRYYRKGNCKHGASGRKCSYDHPKPCLKFLRHGMNMDKGCRMRGKCGGFHPWMCKSSLVRGVCTDENCKLPHVKGTKKSVGIHSTKGTAGEDVSVVRVVERADGGVIPQYRHRGAEQQARKTYASVVSPHKSEVVAKGGDFLPDPTTAFLGKLMESMADQQKQMQQMMSLLMERMDGKEGCRMGRCNKC
jgi:hypothetical protein